MKAKRAVYVSETGWITVYLDPPVETVLEHPSLALRDLPKESFDIGGAEPAFVWPKIVEALKARGVEVPEDLELERDPPELPL